ncbi:hypothetical protein [Actinoplanes couchii]|uniref:Integral membrane protein n=1 Tax=Actinoplanes couchii TaxID=403638 RepID=A0ABQ3XDM7_9ACTN|nr:hypothetical protein [Actinoplanes couchii]MDR6317073.1 hypothetical protein [Actinoplanes couchii]GID56568.1 hypothetical protein Aco03nite_049720 [Actinoplanes couchii]
MPFRVAAKVWQDPRLAWLRAEILDLEDELSSVVKHADADGDLAGRYIQQARAACDRHDVNSGWTHLYRARQELVLLYDEDRLLITAQSLAQEIEDPGRLVTWRAEAARRLLARTGFLPGFDGPAPGLETRRKFVAEALKLRNDGISNDYWRLAIVRHYQTLLIVIGAPILVVVVVMISSAASGFLRESWITGRASCVLAVLLGILGAVTSAAQRSTRIHRERVTVQLGSFTSSFSRIPIGAVAGLTIWLFSIATASAAGINSPNLLLAAFGAGFAERLVVQGNDGERSGAEAPAPPPRADGT